MLLPIERIFNDREHYNTWKEYYFELRKQANISSVGKSSKVAIANRRFNRYSDVLPYDDNRIVLKSGVGYINASQVSFERTGQQYIIAQGPMEVTCHHFWRMVWERHVNSIVMLCKTIENQKSKCAQYWPFSVSKDLSFEEFTVSLLTFSQSSEYNISTFKITNSREERPEERERTISHFHYHAWPDFGIPDSPDSFLKFLCLVRQQSGAGGSTENPSTPVRNSSINSHSEHSSVHSPPPVIHCSAGIGRSGVYAVSDIVIRLLEALPQQEWDSIAFDEILLSLRLQRIGLIQAPDQLRFTFQSILRAKELIVSGEWPSKFLQSPSDEEEEELSEGEEVFMPPPPPPIVPTGAKKDHSGRPQSAANGDVYVNGDSATAKSELRHRKHSETAAKIAEIKKNMKKHESDQEFWSNYWPHFFGIGVLVLGSCAYFYMRTHDSRFFS